MLWIASSSLKLVLQLPCTQKLVIFLLHSLRRVLCNFFFFFLVQRMFRCNTNTMKLTSQITIAQGFAIDYCYGFPNFMVHRIYSFLLMRTFLPNYCFFLNVVTCFQSHIMEFYCNRKLLSWLKYLIRLFFLFLCVIFHFYRLSLISRSSFDMSMLLLHVLQKLQVIIKY